MKCQETVYRNFIAVYYFDADLRLLETIFTGIENLDMSIGAGPRISIPTISFLSFKSRIKLSEMSSLLVIFPFLVEYKKHCSLGHILVKPSLRSLLFIYP